MKYLQTKEALIRVQILKDKYHTKTKKRERYTADEFEEIAEKVAPGMNILFPIRNRNTREFIEMVYEMLSPTVGANDFISIKSMDELVAKQERIKNFMIIAKFLIFMFGRVEKVTR